VRTIAAERSGVSEGRTAQRMRARLVRYIYCHVPHAFTRCAALRQVCALVGDEGDATPFTREVTVEKVSTKLHDNGYQRRGNEALFHLPPRAHSHSLARTDDPNPWSCAPNPYRGHAATTAAVARCRRWAALLCLDFAPLHTGFVCSALGVSGGRSGKVGAARGKWGPLGVSGGRSSTDERFRSCTTDTPAGGCKRSSFSARRTTR
jgi:hypothetical protein